MLESLATTTSTAQHLAVIRLKVPRSQIQQVMGQAIGEVLGAVAAQGLVPAGSVLTHHFTMSPETFDFEVGVPVVRPVAPAGRVVAAELPARKIARAVYRGGYEGLGAAWGEFRAWVKAQGLAPAESLWEVYTAGPETGPDASQWRTELNQPLAE